MDKLRPRFVLSRPHGSARHRALERGETVRERTMGMVAIYTPVRVKPRYWTSQTLLGSVIHIATGRGLLTQGTVATHGQIDVEPYCNGHLEWPRALSSPADYPERRLCQLCLDKAHASESPELSPALLPLRTITVHITTT
ncbi:hypothetical protein [Streptomyces marianii]|uniref:Uncharacterized protein n=1 Tax=Streptomyces marianii TaxID=1817406 RepID=A0A5R9E254_9ACTN|nr:hypothetical protein [Streptomyces marianii]TLQ43467.1 hypothetical protein FEF34_10205 [Streptomyces marianii]